MRPLGWVGVLLIVAGAVIAGMGGIGYTKSRNEVEVGPIKVAAEERGLVPPLAGVVAIAVGAILVFVGRKRPA
jgi:drug/metabolite transporter (DMT)-like permease